MGAMTTLDPGQGDEAEATPNPAATGSLAGPDLAVTADTPAAIEPEGVGGPAAGDAVPADAAVRGRRRTRWLIGGAVAVAAVAAAIWVALVLGSRPLAEALRYVPADAVVVGELRPDLPGDQRQHLGNFLARFPGFADQSNLDTKLDEALGRLTSSVSGGSVDYQKQVKPLLTGPLVVALLPDGLRAMSSGSPAGGSVPGGFLLVATTDGTATCDAAFGSTTAGETHRDVELRTVGGRLACAVQKGFMLVGDPAAVVAGLDARLDGKGIDTSSTYRAALDALAGDQLGTLFLDGKRLTDALGSAVPALAGDTALTARVPAWLVAGLRLADDAIQVDVQSAALPAAVLPSDAPTAAPPATSAFATLLPTDAFGFVEWHGAGASIQRLLAQLRADPKTVAAVTQIESALAVAGGVGNVLGWIDDVGIAAIPAGESTGAIALIRGSSADAVAGRLAQIHNLLVLASTGTDLTLRDSDHNGVTITSVSVGDIGAVLKALGLPAGTVGVPQGTTGAGMPLTISLAARGDVMLLGIGDGVIERALDANPATSVGSTSSYRRALDLAGTSNDLQLFGAIDGIVEWAAGHLLPEADRGGWEKDVKPYVEHFAGLAATSTSSAAGYHARLILTVK